MQLRRKSGNHWCKPRALSSRIHLFAQWPSICYRQTLVPIRKHLYPKTACSQRQTRPRTVFVVAKSRQRDTLGRIYYQKDHRTLCYQQATQYLGWEGRQSRVWKSCIHGWGSGLRLRGRIWDMGISERPSVQRWRVGTRPRVLSNGEKALRCINFWIGLCAFGICNSIAGHVSCAPTVH